MGEDLPKIEAWRKSGDYLPSFMRDFHDQKDLFKALHEVAERYDAGPGGPRLDGLGWVGAQCYTIDVFLWVMARHGYTLQRSRKPFKFPDVLGFIGAAKKRRDALHAEQLKAILHG